MFTKATYIPVIVALLAATGAVGCTHEVLERSFTIDEDSVLAIEADSSLAKSMSYEPLYWVAGQSMENFASM